MTIRDLQTLDATVRQAVASVTITDIHTHLFPPSHGKLLLWNVDELLTYHYLVAELFTLAPRNVTPEDFWKLPKSAQADLIWKHVFIEHGPLSEATRGVMTTLTQLGLDISDRDLTGIRKWFAQQQVDQYIEKVFQTANLDYAVMTNDPFKMEEVQEWNAGKGTIDRFKTALRIDTLIINWPAAAKIMSQQGYSVSEGRTAADYAQARKFLTDWAHKIKPMYMAASLGADFTYPSDDASTAIIDNVVMPVAMELNLPMAMMIGVRRGVNPLLHEGSDSVGVADVTAVQHLCQKYPQAKFLCTMLSRVNQHELCILARKFGNLHLFGCWWFCNNPSIIRELTEMRLELLGTAITCQHSDARVLDQVIYKWNHSRKIVADVLAGKYAMAFEAGWRPTEAEIQRDARAIFGGTFEQFLAK